MKLLRYHIQIFCPEWTRNSILKFSTKLKGIVLENSFHAKKKIAGMKRKYRVYTKNLIKTIDLSDEIYLDYIFEFYTNTKNEVKKVCYRFPMKELDSDLILVVSSTGKVVTVYLNNNFNGVDKLNRDLYEKGDNE